jgi:hypothetical protein
MPYCPKCRFEYKAIVETCPDCGERLIAKPSETKRIKMKSVRTKTHKRRIEPRMKPLYVTNKAAYVRFLKEALENNGITCLIKRGPSGLVLPSMPLSFYDTSVFVREEDYEKSCEIKEQIVDSL